VTFIPSGFFVLRTPLLPFEEFLAWGEGLEAAGAVADPQRLERALAADRAVLRARLRAIAAEPIVREALFVASPDLHESLDVWVREPDNERGARIERALVSYFSRMAGRPMPFGLFAGCSLGTIGSMTNLAIEGRPAYRRSTRLDMSYLSSLAEALLRDPELRKSLSYRPNSSLYRTARRVRYVEARLGGKGRSYRLISVEDTEHLSLTLERAKTGATPGSLAEALVERVAGVTMEEAWDYIHDLIDSQILVPDLEVPVTGPEPILGLMNELNASRCCVEVPERLREARTDLASLDDGGLGADVSRYKEIAKGLERLPAKVDLRRLFQVDMFKPSPAASLGGQPLAEIVEGVQILHRLVSATTEPQFARFKERFVARYEGQQVPLLELLDEEAGIGFLASAAPGAEASPLLDGLPIAAATASETGRWNGRDGFLLHKMQQAASSGAREIVLTHGDLNAMRSPHPPPLPDAFSVTATLSAQSPAALSNGDFRIFLRFASGPTGARLMGRFCHADEALRSHVESHLLAEEACDPEAVFAEIVHLPEGRLGNVLCRPVLRGYEIPYLGKSGAPAERRLPVGDLTVGVEAGRIVLRSRRLGKRVVPRLTTAHSYDGRSLGVYRFLCSVQNQGVSSGLAWSWGALESMAFLPRVTTGRLILALARWRLDGETLRALASARGPERYQLVQRFRAERAVPRYVDLVESDKELPLDLENSLSIDSFIDMVKRRHSALLKEVFPAQEELCARGPEGRFIHEVIIPFVRTPDPPRPDRFHDAPASHRIARRFPPGSEWIYARLYTGTASADMVLSEAVRPLVAEAVRSGAADRWFFIRYSDPDWHIRLRLHGNHRKLVSDVLPAMHELLQPLVKDGLVWRVQLDTYEREVERYGGAEGIELAERIFHADSEACLAVLAQLEGEDGAEARWRLTLRGIDMLLSDLGLDLEARRTLAARARKSLGEEFRSGKSLAIQMGAKFRKERGELERLLEPAIHEEHPLAPAIEPFRERSTWLAPQVEELRSLQSTGRLSVPLTDFAASCVHLHVNRMLRSAHRAHELVLYDFLERLYESRAARVATARARERHATRQP